MSRTERLEIRVSEAERRAIRERAALAEMPVSEWVRFASMHARLPRDVGGEDGEGEDVEERRD